MRYLSICLSQEELISTVNKMKTKLEKEITNHQETKQNISDMSSLIHELQAQVKCYISLLTLVAKCLCILIFIEFSKRILSIY